MSAIDTPTMASNTFAITGLGECFETAAYGGEPACSANKDLQQDLGWTPPAL